MSYSLLKICVHLHFAFSIVQKESCLTTLFLRTDWRKMKLEYFSVKLSLLWPTFTTMVMLTEISNQWVTDLKFANLKQVGAWFCTFFYLLVLAWFRHVTCPNSLTKTILQSTLEVGHTMVGRGNAGWTTSKSACLPIPELLTKTFCRKTGRGYLQNSPLCPPDNPVGQGTELNWIWSMIEASQGLLMIPEAKT